MDRLYHLTRIEDLSLPIIGKLFDKTERYVKYLRQKITEDISLPPPNNLAGVRVYVVFFEESTRTYSTFHSAALELGALVTGFPLATKFSAFAEGKDESLEHAIAFWSGAAIPHLRLADIIVIRHFRADACQRAARISGVPIIDAGTGGEEGQHITQGLLDAYSFRQFLGKKNSLKIVFAGDLRFSRIIPTEVPLLHMIYSKLEVGLVAPEGFTINPKTKQFLVLNGIPFTEFESIEEAIESDHWEICYVLRTQKNRLDLMEDQKEAERLWTRFLVNKDRFAATKRVYDLSEKGGTIFCHPGPIDSNLREIRPEIEGLQRTRFLEQWAYGFPIRMAILSEVRETQKEIDANR